MKRLTDKRIVDTVYEYTLCDGYPPTTEYIVQAFPMFEEETVKQALIRAHDRGKVKKQGEHWSIPI